MISHEMLKSSQDTIAEPIAKVFNLLVDSQLCPSLWSKNIFLPLHKGGDLDDPDNYKGYIHKLLFCYTLQLGFE